MQLESSTPSARDVGVIGWITIADALLAGLILLAALNWSSSRQVEQLQAQLATADEETARATKQSQDINEKLAAAQQELAQAKAEVAGLLTANDSLRKRSAELDKALRELRQRFEVAGKDTVELLNELKALRDQLKQARQAERQAQDQASAAAQDTGALSAWLKGAQAEKRTLQALLKEVEDELKKVRDDLSKMRSAERQVHKDLLGLRGDLKRVVLILDASGSMTEGGRWKQALDVVKTWLEHLEVEECVFIIFNVSVRTFPENGTFLDMRRPHGTDNRQQLLQQLEGLKPAGGTNTLAALEKAYSYPKVDTIILFTDGAPNDGKSSEFDPKIAEKIYELCEKHKKEKDIYVNAIGLGDYFRPELSAFLQKIAKVTGGTFLGR